MSKREEVVLRYRSISPPYYHEEYEDEKLEGRVLNFEPQIHYVVEQETIIQAIKMSRTDTCNKMRNCNLTKNKTNNSRRYTYGC
jgi:hypothetical protein